MRKRNSSYKKLNIEFHSTYLIMALGFILTGYYLNLIVFTSLILVHEIGHYLMAIINKFNVVKIIIYPYGGLTKIEDIINKDINEELLIASFGIIFQYLFYLLIIFLYSKGIIRNYTYNLYALYNNQMIFFNMLPIYPLDGGRILNLLFDKILPYYMANIVTIVISLFIIILIIGLNIYQSNYSNIMIIGLLLVYLYKFFSKRKYLYNKFLLERYLYKIEYPKIKIINNISSMFKNKTHIVKDNNSYIKEEEILNKLFDKRKN